MKARTPEELASLLGHRDQRVRQEAQFEWARRGPDSIAPLKSLAAKSEHDRIRIHALRALGQLARNHPATLTPPLLELARQAEGEPRVQAIRALASATEIVRQPGVA
ncbi:MAG: HEAT repeat domain-containing protein, partial [bacterium]